ncbi:MAG: hypothetical protein JKY19_01765 [Alcanivoracaceae bacterium]|nr:hypothetical protein [Alcanivoracaceae bacterium]
MKFFDTVMMPILLLANILFGVLLVSRQRMKLRLYLIIFLVLMILDILSLFQLELQRYDYLKLVLYSIFYVSITNDIIKQVWYTKRVTKNTIFGLMSGYIALGLVFFFIFTTIEIFYNGSFSQIKFADGNVVSTMDTLLYFSYVTMMTLGYGDIVPLTEVAQKAAILCGLIGQFYLVIVTAIIVGKYIKHSTES